MEKWDVIISTFGMIVINLVLRKMVFRMKMKVLVSPIYTELYKIEVAREIQPMGSNISNML